MSSQNQQGSQSAVKGILQASLLGHYIFPSATIDYKSVMDMYIANLEAQNDWSKTQQKQILQQQEYINGLAESTKSGTLEQADNLVCQAAGTFVGLAGPAGSIVGAIAGNKAVSAETEYNTKMGTANNEIGRATYAPATDIITDSRAAPGTLVKFNPTTGMEEPVAMSQARAARIVELRGELEERGGVDRMFKENGLTRPDTDRGWADVKLEDSPTPGEAPITLKDVMEASDDAQRKKIKGNVGKAYHASTTALNSANTRAQVKVQTWQGIGQALSSVGQGIEKVIEAGNTRDQAQDQYNQNVFSGAKDQVANVVSAEAQAKDKAAKATSEDTWGVLERLRAADKSALAG